MLIIQATGQTCNQFWIYSNFIADCIEKEEKMVIWVPDVSLYYFPNFHNSKWISFPLYYATFAKVIGHKRYIQILTILFGNKFIISFLNEFLNKLPGLTFIIANVGRENSKYRIKHFNQIKHILTPAKLITDEVDTFFSIKRNQCDILVGVHIRYGDYRNFIDGRYFYTIPEYQTIMLHIKSLFSEKKVLFFISSNENIDLSLFTRIECFAMPSTFSVKDLYGLSLCDYIIGPPSTFSAWASLYQNVPLYFIENLNEHISLNNFIYMKNKWL